MDEMKIVSGFTTTLVSKLLRFALRKKLGYDIHIQLNTLEATIADPFLKCGMILLCLRPAPYPMRLTE